MCFCVKKIAAKEGQLDLSIDSQRRSSTHSQERGQGRRKFLHHWIAGNLPLNSECEVCEEACGDGPGIVDLRCCWSVSYTHLRAHDPSLQRVCPRGV